MTDLLQDILFSINDYDASAEEVLSDEAKLPLPLPKSVADLINEYHSYQQELPIAEAEPQLQDLVRFNGNKVTPVHSWFVYKEGFSARLLPWLCRTLDRPLNELTSILDPFCGAGTSLLSAQLMYEGEHLLNAYGIEYNPFVRFVSQAKLSWPKYNPKRIAELIPRLLAHRSCPSDLQYEIPELSTMHNPKVFAPALLQELLYYRHLIEEEVGTELECDFFLLGWASVIERVSGVRKDGRALRFKEKSDVPSVAAALRDQWEAMLADLHKLVWESTNHQNVICNVLAGDGRTLANPELNGKQFDMILYSPPYLNNIDYSEVYKLELWLSGHIKTNREFKDLRLGTLRSHPSVKFPDSNLINDLPQDTWPQRLKRALMSALPQDEHYLERTRIIQGYMDDMYLALTNQFKVAQPNAPIICIAGNSLHGRRPHPIPIATDLLITALAQQVGLQVDRLQIARHLRRRDGASEELLRETIIIMRRPVST